MVKIFEVFVETEFVHIVMEHCSGGELYDYVSKNGKITEQDAAIIVSKLIKVVKYLNTRNISHRDLKPENIMFDEESKEIKIIDFGLSSMFE